PAVSRRRCSSTVTATPDPYPLSLHDALPICPAPGVVAGVVRPHCPHLGGGQGEDAFHGVESGPHVGARHHAPRGPVPALGQGLRSEEHTSELQSRVDLVCRLLLEKETTGCSH